MKSRLAAASSSSVEQAVVAARASVQNALLSALSAYNPGNKEEFGPLVGQALAYIGNTDRVARVLGVSAATLHRWPKNLDQAPVAIVRLAVVAMLELLVRDGLEGVEADTEAAFRSVQATAQSRILASTKPRDLVGSG